MKTGNLTYVYGAVAILSALLLLGYILWEKRKERSFLLLIGCVAVANWGYFLLALANTRSFALFSNGVAYLGSAYSVLAMLLIITEVCQVLRGRKFRFAFAAVSTAAFLLAASGEWLGLYYRSVVLVTVNGMSRLIKDYGPLHVLYTVYLLSYVLTMVGVIWNAWKRRRLHTMKYTTLLMMAVLLNLGVWAVEQAVDVDFEFLSISYIVTEVILLLLYGIFRDYGIVQPGGALVSVQMLTELHTRYVDTGTLPAGMEEMFRSFARRVKELSAAERRILNYYISGHEIAEIPELAFISIHTVKKHNRSIYQKLDISSRDELMLYIELFRCCGRLEELTSGGGETE